MALTDAQKADVRRHAGYPVYGSQVGSNAGYRFFQAYGTLEFRMSNLRPEEETVLTATYLPNLNTLETAIFGTGANLDTAKAAVWEHNENELRDREALYKSVRLKLCAMLGVPGGPALSAGMRITV